MKYSVMIAASALWLASQPAMATDKITQDDIDLVASTYDMLVDKHGNITPPKNYRQNWSHIGSWTVLDPKAPGHGFHDVYAQKEAVEAYRKTGKFPDGTVLVKEVNKVESGAKTTGQAQWAGDTNVWFVMVKDDKNRFPGNKHWQEGWGWGLYEAKNPFKNVSKGFNETCFACHAPARNMDWVFIEGYPTLKK